MKNKQIMLKIINNLKSNLDLASIQLVLHGYKNASYSCIRIKNFKIKQKFIKIKDKNFTWLFHPLLQNDLVSVYLIDNRIKNKTDKLFLSILKDKYNIHSNYKIGNIFEKIIEQFIHYFMNEKKVNFSNNQKLKQNLICGLYYSYPIDDVFEFIHENYILKKMNKQRKPLFFYTKYDQFGYISYSNNKKYLLKLKNDYIKICKQNNHNFKLSNYDKILNTLELDIKTL